MNTQVLSSIAQAAQASYESLSAGDTLDILARKLQTSRGGFSLTQSQNFAFEQSVVLQYNDDEVESGGTGTSLSLTVFKDTSGQLTLAIRGTLEFADFTPTDANIFTMGAGYDQIAALYNWWQ